MKMKINLFLIMILIFSVGVSAFDYTFTNDDNVFNSALTDTDIYTKAINDAKFSPQFIDLDNNSIDEIVIFRETGVSFYSGVSLTLLNTFNVGNVSSFYIFDYDNDGIPNIMMFIGNTIKILSYNGTGTPIERDIYINDTFSYVFTPEFGDGLISCDDTESCLFLYSVGFNNGFGQQENNLNAMFFNSSIVNDSVALYSKITGTGGAYYKYATARLGYMDSSKDTDLDSYKNYMSSWLLDDGSLNIYSIQLTTDNVPYVTDSVEINDFITLTGYYDSRLYNDYFSEPLIMDIDGASGTGYESVIAVNIDEDDFKLLSFDNDLDIIDDYPEIDTGKGLIMSNVIPFNAFTDTGKNDFCVLGNNYIAGGEKIINLVCGSELTSEIPQTSKFFMRDSPSYNLSSNPIWENVIYSTNSIQTLTHGNDLDELVTSYGIYELDYIGIDELVQVFNNPKEGSVVLHTVGSAELPDMLILTSSNLWLFDDKYENAPPEIDAYYTNPCLNATWKVNTSVEIRITPRDETDTVRARAVLYDGETFAQDSNYTDYSTSGTVFSFPFVANVTGSNYKLGLYVTDSYNPETETSIFFTFSVGSNGVEFGECITDVSGIVETSTSTENATSDAETNNALTQSIENTANVTGLGTSLTWLLFMGVLAIVILLFDKEKGEDMTGRVIVVVICEIIMLIMGVKLGFISAGIIWIMLILAILLISFWIGRKIQSPTG